MTYMKEQDLQICKLIYAILHSAIQECNEKRRALTCFLSIDEALSASLELIGFRVLETFSVKCGGDSEMLGTVVSGSYLTS